MPKLERWFSEIAVEFWVRMNDYIPQFHAQVIAYPYYKLNVSLGNLSL